MLAKSVCHYASMDSTLFLCGLLLKLLMGQLLVGCAKHTQVTNIVPLVLIIFVHVLHKHQIKVCVHTHSLSSLMLSADPEDYSSAVHYNVTFCQTAVTDTQTPARSTVSSPPILIDITDDDIFEGVEYFQARIVETSDRFRVRIGRDTVNVTIIDSESFSTSGNIGNPDYSWNYFPYSYTLWLWCNRICSFDAVMMVCIIYIYIMYQWLCLLCVVAIANYGQWWKCFVHNLKIVASLCFLKDFFDIELL